MLKLIRNTSYFIIFTSLLAACGGSGSDGNSQDNNDDSGSQPPVVTNQAPTLDNALDNQTINVGDSLNLDLSTVFSDPDNDALSYSASVQPNTNELAINGNRLIGTPTSAQTYVIDITAADPAGLTATDQFSLKVNGAPQLNQAIANQTVFLNESYSYDVSQQNTTFIDPNNDALNYAVSISPENSGLTLNQTTLSGTPSQNEVYTITVIASDDGQLSSQTQYQLSVLSQTENNAPIVANPISDQNIFTNAFFTLDLSQSGTTFNDPDGDTLSYSVDISPEDSGFSADQLTLSGTATQTGQVTVSVTASDPAGLSASDTFVIKVTEAVVSNKKNILLIIADDFGQDSSNQYSFSTRLANNANYRPTCRARRCF